ncbi:MAG: carbohydrate-binding domain-containing protein [Pseudomonadota bacterium]|nr:carbohydrate-binding domain-containing protein [Pseudomonadota bacterium]
MSEPAANGAPGDALAAVVERPVPPAASVLAALLLVVAVAFTPDLPWHAGPAALGLAALGWRDPHWIWSALGAALLWVPALSGPAGAVVLGGSIVLGALRWRALSTAVVLVGVALAAKQGAASVVLPAAATVVPWLLVSLVTTAGAVSAVRGGRAEAGALALAGAIIVTRLALVWAVEGEARVEAAARIGALDFVYQDLAEDASEPISLALLAAGPGRDGAALRLGWARALDLGWRPAKAEGVVIEVARALELRGRGGEALRLLARHPREGQVDALRALLERIQGVPVRWRGAALGTPLPGRFDPGLEFDTNGLASVEITATTALAALTLGGVGAPYVGAPVLEVRLDGDAAVDWTLDGPGEFVLPGPIPTGPHRISVRFVNDLVDAEGDRNVRVTEIRADAARP